jgi:hypothetical protein
MGFGNPTTLISRQDSGQARGGDRTNRFDQSLQQHPRPNRLTPQGVAPIIEPRLVAFLVLW